jgi:DNA polymerase I
MFNVSELDSCYDLRVWLSQFSKEVLALDIETTGLVKGSDVISFALCHGSDVAFCTPDLLKVLPEFQDITYVMHHMNFDIKHIAWFSGVNLIDTNECIDTITMHHLLNENVSHSLGDVVLETYSDNYKDEFWKKYPKVELAPRDELIEYNARDVYYTHKLYHSFIESLRMQDLTDLFRQTTDVQRALIRTEIVGVKIDVPYLLEKGTELKSKREALLPKMYECVSEEIYFIENEMWIKEMDLRKTKKGKSNVPRPKFSFNSGKQLKELLYVQLGLPEQYNEKTKKLSTDWDSLEKLKDEHEIVALIQEYAEMEKIIGTYIDGTVDRLSDGRIYPSFNVSGTKTGRLSHSEPNLAQLPRAGGVRGMFIPDDGHVFITADFSQLEVRLSAHFTNDKSLLKIVNEGASQHDITAEALGIERQTAKTVNFALQYGATAFKLMKVLKCSKKEAEAAFNTYWETYSGQRDKMAECSAMVDRGEDIISPFGRRRRFEAMKRQAWDGAYRQSWNALVQGTGSDLCGLAFVEIDNYLRYNKYGKALFTVHDEIIITCKKEVAETCEKKLVEVMSEVGKAINLSVPLVAESSGPCERWED